MKKYSDDPEYKRLKEIYLLAIKAIHFIELDQYFTRTVLRFESNPEERTRLRKLLKQNRRGPEGLRSLNKKIRAFYKYCEKHWY